MFTRYQNYRANTQKYKLTKDRSRESMPFYAPREAQIVTDVDLKKDKLQKIYDKVPK